MKNADHREWECRSPNETRIGDDLLGARSMAVLASPRYDARLRRLTTRIPTDIHLEQANNGEQRSNILV